MWLVTCARSFLVVAISMLTIIVMVKLARWGCLRKERGKSECRVLYLSSRGWIPKLHGFKRSIYHLGSPKESASHGVGGAMADRNKASYVGQQL